MIKFVYFDLGGVVIDDFSGNNGWKELKHELGVTDDIEPEFDKAWRPLEHEALVGRNVESLLPELKSRFELNTPTTYSLLNGFVSRFKANMPIWPVIEKVRQHSHIGLLTNAYPGMLDAIRAKGILPPTEWDIVVDSSIEMLKKPDFQLFELAERRAGVDRGEVLFIDNTIGHIKEAESFGWHVYLYNSSDHEASCKALDQYINTLI